MNDDDLQGGHPHSTLVRIAQTLNVPVATFLTFDSTGTRDTEAAVTKNENPAQLLALLRLFVQLESPETRARCLAYVVQQVSSND